MPLELDASVGHGGVNRAADVRAVQQRLNALGYAFFPIDSRVGPGLIHAIRLFQCIIAGRHRLSGADGRVDVGLTTHRWLDTANAPRWETMPVSGPGFVNHEAEDVSDYHDYGTSWMAEVIRRAGQRYERAHRREHDAAPMAINDVSLPTGGDTPDHGGHETGLACDLRLPRLDGGAGGIARPNRNSHYDRAAMRAQLQALWSQPTVTHVFFNDDALVAEELCQHLAGHNDHAHFQIQPPRPG